MVYLIATATKSTAHAQYHVTYALAVPKTTRNNFLCIHFSTFMGLRWRV